MKEFTSKHKYKLLFLLIIIAMISAGTVLYLKKKKAKDLKLSKERPSTTVSTKEEPKEPLIVEKIVEDSTQATVKPAIIETQDIPK